MDPLQWGPCVWHTLNGMACSKKSASYLVRIVDVLCDTLPCSHCRSSFRHFCKTNSNDVCVKDPKLYIWSMHDEVNKKLRRPCISFRVFCKRSKCFDYNPEVNAVHMMCFILRNAQTSNMQEHMRQLTTLFDLFCDVFAEDARWRQIHHETQGRTVEEALQTARRILLHDELSEEEFRAVYDSALSTATADAGNRQRR